jgi:hypothetical protein
LNRVGHRPFQHRIPLRVGTAPMLLVPIGVGVGIGIGIDSDSDPDTDPDPDYNSYRDRVGTAHPGRIESCFRAACP